MEIATMNSQWTWYVLCFGLWIVNSAMKLVLIVFGLVLVIGGFAYQFAALQTFNLLVPKDSGVQQVARSIAYGADPRQSFDVYRPEAPGTFPLLVFVYGGSWASGAKEPYEFAARALAARGYVVVVPDYRLVPEHVYPAFVQDVALAIAVAQKQTGKFGADVSRTFLVGHSAGAYNITQAVLQRRFLQAAGVDEAALRAVATLAGPFDFVPLDVSSTINAFGHVTDLSDTQPMKHARKDAPPFLILHGEADTTVFLKSPHALENALKAAGGRAELKIYPGVSHVKIILALAKPLRNADAPVLDDVISFFERHTPR
jgi:acetyl esterase/lipase